MRKFTRYYSKALILSCFTKNEDGSKHIFIIFIHFLTCFILSDILCDKYIFITFIRF
jgi:hypothetical protein